MTRVQRARILYDPSRESADLRYNPVSSNSERGKSVFTQRALEFYPVAGFYGVQLVFGREMVIWEDFVVEFFPSFGF